MSATIQDGNVHGDRRMQCPPGFQSIDDQCVRITTGDGALKSHVVVESSQSTTAESDATANTANVDQNAIVDSDNRSTGSLVAAILLTFLVGMLVAVLVGGYLANEQETTISMQLASISILWDELDDCKNSTNADSVRKAMSKVVSLTNELRECKNLLPCPSLPVVQVIHVPYANVCIFWTLVAACVLLSANAVHWLFKTKSVLKRLSLYEECWTTYRKRSFAALIGFYEKKVYAKRIRGRQYLDWIDKLSGAELDALNGTLATCGGTRLPEHLFEDSASESQSTMHEIWEAYSSGLVSSRTLVTLQYALFQMAESGLFSAKSLEEVD
jgi:hypothetical protein